MASVKFKSKQIRSQSVIQAVDTLLKFDASGSIKDAISYFRNKIVLEIEDREELKAVISFFKQKYEHEKETGNERSISCELQLWYKRRSIKQWRLYMEIISRLALADSDDWRNIHAGFKGLYYPRIGPEGMKVPVDSADLSTVEMAKVIEGAVLACSQHDPVVDISDIWILWTDFRGQQEADPLEGTYKDATDYVDRHPNCEICGKGLVESEAPDGTKQREGQLMHIVSKGAGGPDDLNNRILGCTQCHIEDQHQQEGWKGLIDIYPYIAQRINKAYDKYSSVHKLETEETEQLEIF